MAVHKIPDNIDTSHGGGDVVDDGRLELVVQLLGLQNALQPSHIPLTECRLRKMTQTKRFSG
jgi:hypothetical protein